MKRKNDLEKERSSNEIKSTKIFNIITDDWTNRYIYSNTLDLVCDFLNCD